MSNNERVKKLFDAVLAAPFQISPEMEKDFLATLATSGKIYLRRTFDKNGNMTTEIIHPYED